MKCTIYFRVSFRSNGCSNTAAATTKKWSTLNENRYFFLSLQSIDFPKNSFSNCLIPDLPIRSVTEPNYDILSAVNLIPIERYFNRKTQLSLESNEMASFEMAPICFGKMNWSNCDNRCEHRYETVSPAFRRQWNWGLFCLNAIVIYLINSIDYL